MKSLIFSVLVGMLPFVALAQNDKPFKVNVAAGYALPTEKGGGTGLSKGGFVYSIEPQYRIINNVDVGVRIEQAFIQRSEAIDKVIFLPTKTTSVLSGLVTLNYTLNLSGTFRPFVGIGGGVYYAGESNQVYRSGSSSVPYPLPATAILGGMGRVGVKFGAFSVLADYNVVSDTQVTNNATKLTLSAKNSYFSLKAGFTFGGGDNK